MSPAQTQGHPTVQLLHELPDGSRHVDWMIAQDPRGRDPLVTFRVQQRVDDLPAGQRIEAVRLADHRPAYLAYEGPVSGDRGTVKRLARGTAAVLDEGPDGCRVEVCWESPPGRPQPQQLRLTRPGPESAVWVIEALGDS
ncbi:MAG: hypothetical protein ACYSW1_16415 [Planctomycetota bacterium]|jgi:hypothetical protein